MNRLGYALPLLLALGAGTAVAQERRGPDAPVSTARSVLSAQDGAPVTLRGHINARHTRDRYVFTDESGSVLVSLKDFEIRGNLAGGTAVEIHGRVNASDGQTQVDAESVRVIRWNPLSSSPDGNPPMSGGRGYQHFETD